jgi:hypothetical protein
MFNINHTNETITVSKKLNDIKLAIAELSIIPDNSLVDNMDGTWFYFNRLNVPLEFRNQGIASQMVDIITGICDKNKYNIWLDINPYGEMNYFQLKIFYIKNGFRKHKNSLIRMFVDIGD